MLHTCAHVRNLTLEHPRGSEYINDNIVYLKIAALTYVDDDASQGTDYTPTTVLEVPNTTGSTRGQIAFFFPIENDDIVEDDEVFRIVLGSVTGPDDYMRSDLVVFTDVSEDQSTVVTIQDDDSGTWKTVDMMYIALEVNNTRIKSVLESLRQILLQISCRHKTTFLYPTA